ncbi:MAG TPA: glycoside hydrolase family 99-like domain-containing protein [Ignavibacteria bacterium]
MKIKCIAHYLPQYHPIPENDKWWGKGFTEWTNVAKAKPLFKGHQQPKVPADLGFYDLRLPEIREQQAEMARKNGIYGFCYWHYWFNGKRLLERPFDEVLQSGKPDFPFCLAWANESWTGIWYGAHDKLLIEQTYGGKNDLINHFKYLEKAFTDSRYIKIDNKPIFVIYRPSYLPDSKFILDFWREMAVKIGFSGIYFIGSLNSEEVLKVNKRDSGFDGFIATNPDQMTSRYKGKKISVDGFVPVMKSNVKKIIPVEKIRNYLYKAQIKPNILDYKECIKYAFSDYELDDDHFPSVLPNWDNTPRCGRNGTVLQGSTPESFGKHLSDAVKLLEKKPDNKKLIFLKSWNEWAEGNYLEPDIIWGTQYLETTKKIIEQNNK